jgi:hypothetical protein
MSFKSTSDKEENLLAQHMHQLLMMPVEKDKEDELLKSGYGGEVNKGVLMANAVLEKAIEKGDVTAFKEIKALVSEDEEEASLLEEMICAIGRELNLSAGGKKKADSVGKKTKRARKSSVPAAPE